MGENSYNVNRLTDKKSPWKKTGDTFTGKSEEAFWMINQLTRQKALVKIPKERKRFEEDSGKFSGKYSGEHLAEKIASELGLELGLKMPEIDLAIYNNKKCCMSYSFVNSKMTLREGNQILNFEITEDKNRNKYTLQNIIDDIEEYNINIDKIIGMMLFDALVGQMDRHEKNWGILIPANDDFYKFAPIYDNSSCLSREAHNHRHDIDIKLNDSGHFLAYLRKAESIIRLERDKENKLSHFEIIQYLADEYRDIYEEFCLKLNRLEKSTIKNIIWKVPDDFILLDHKRVILKIILERKNEILNIID